MIDWDKPIQIRAHADLWIDAQWHRKVQDQVVCSFERPDGLRAGVFAYDEIRNTPEKPITVTKRLYLWNDGDIVEGRLDNCNRLYRDSSLASVDVTFTIGEFAE